MTSPNSTQTSPDSEATAPPATRLDLSDLPPIYVLPVHMDETALYDIESKFLQYGATLTYDIKETRLAFANLEKKVRAKLELRWLQLWTEETVSQPAATEIDDTVHTVQPLAKRRRLDDGLVVAEVDPNDGHSTTDNESTVSDTHFGMESILPHDDSSIPSLSVPPALELVDMCTFPMNTITVIKLNWLEDCITAQKLLSLREYMIYQGRPVQAPQVVKRANADAGGHTPQVPTLPERRGFGTRHAMSDKRIHHQTSQLPLETTAEHEGGESDIPMEPDWVKSGLRYACQRVTPPNPPNQAFIEVLKQIRLERILIMDEIGVRAYSTSIAAVAAYPYEITTPREITRLPGCETKLANIWVEWKNTGRVQEAERMSTDEHLVKLNLFYNIWGVGAQTAHQFYYDRCWQDLDDVIDYGWKDLHRVQQIGVKYYDEFLDPIPRSEVESIVSVIRTHAIKVRDPGIEVVIVGGYRRGKSASGDVDVIVSHRSLKATQGLARDIVLSLEREEWITHTLIHSENNSLREQSTLPFKASGAGGGHGFDSLDKALVVWQHPQWSTKAEDLEANPGNVRNPNIHRRVDIIISPWRTVGCAIMGWSGGTTFQRDVRRYAKNVKNWKFDSSGVRDRGSGLLVPLEGPEGVSGSWQDAERKVFEGLGLEYREPWERCTN
ncbi:Nucleotidyltransferase [Pseudovirgaria hyperparasitica]|uniref:DNA polymerase n=1 Tax=Pseudovirgaria hyperparasitica TaxID=470096 RepID=A0A6A6WMV5_9PEZI|nr:Nucleotidyltransferase [Pseudovirgaria hyperparasitica]KAF2763577.1 Nucleotidyltransferase [Pseudovirgaria hyperparasitica]